MSSRVHRRRVVPVLVAAIVVAPALFCSAGIGCLRAPRGAAGPPALQDAGAAAPHWTYHGATGPAHWGSLAPEYALCDTGKQQSPIDIASVTAADLANISFHYEPVPIEI